jgi:hypothetical protein
LFWIEKITLSIVGVVVEVGVQGEYRRWCVDVGRPSMNWPTSYFSIFFLVFREVIFDEVSNSHNNTLPGCVCSILWLSRKINFWRFYVQAWMATSHDRRLKLNNYCRDRSLYWVIFSDKLNNFLYHRKCITLIFRFLLFAELRRWWNLPRLKMCN